MFFKEVAKAVWGMFIVRGFEGNKQKTKRFFSEKEERDREERKKLKTKKGPTYIRFR